MADYRFKFKALIDALVGNATATWGSVRSQFPQPDLDWPQGTGSGTCDKFWSRIGQSIANAANDDWDLRALLIGPEGSTVNLAEVRFFAIRPRDGDLTMTGPAGAANDFTGFYAIGDVLQIKQGAYWIIACDRDGEYPTSATSKDIRISNNSGAAVIYDLLIVGVSA